MIVFESEDSLRGEGRIAPHHTVRKIFRAQNVSDTPIYHKHITVCVHLWHHIMRRYLAKIFCDMMPQMYTYCNMS